MRVHHLSCGTMCPPVPRSWIGDEGKLICHCLLVETNDGLVLVDTGIGLEDVRRPRQRLGAGFVWGVRPRLDEAETALRQVERLGFRGEDVRHIVPTHLDLDHAGGLADFPGAKVHVYQPEYDAAMSRASFLLRERYRPALWEHGPSWATHLQSGERWMGFEAVRAIPGLDAEVLLVPLVGHSPGHCAIAVRAGAGWLLHCGDAYFHRDEMDPARARAPRGLDLFQRAAQVNAKTRLYNQDRLRKLKREHAEDLQVFCAHDPVELAALAAAAG